MNNFISQEEQNAAFGEGCSESSVFVTADQRPLQIGMGGTAGNSSQKQNGYNLLASQ